MIPEQRRLLDAYVEGVNEGLGALGARPWECFALRATPRPWTREDSVLVIDAMAMTQETDGTDERSEQAIRQTYGDETLAFLCPSITEGSATLDGSTAPAPPVPDAAHFRPRSLVPGEIAPVPVLTMGAATVNLGEMPGSNAFALAGARTTSSKALVTNDPHLRLVVPNIWYRASLVLPERTVTGATLPGVPMVVVGSNGDIAWAFTNDLIDTCDLVLVEIDPADATPYRVPDGSGWEPFEVVHLGDGGYVDPVRAAQLRDRLSALTSQPAQPADLLAIQLDDEARYLTRWRESLLRVLTNETVAGQASLGELREIVRGWNGHTSTDAIGYRVVREFRRAVTEAVMDPIFAQVKQRDSEAEPDSCVQQSLWSILDARPAYLLPPSASSWDNLLLDAARATADPGKYKPGGDSLAECT